jgi:hypothetical protein
MLSKDLYDRIATRVVEECAKRGLNGVFAMQELTSFRIYYSFVRMVKPMRQGVKGKRDANFLAIALAKLAMVIVHERDTGYETMVIGEVPFAGGRLSKDRRFAYAFSGASPEEDAEIAEFAEDFHRSLR